MKEKYQVVIIGAGPAGSTCAIELLRNGLKDVLLIESGGFDKFRIGESVPPEFNLILQDLGIYNEFIKEGHEPCYGNCSYWGSHHPGYNDSFINMNGHGWHLDRKQFDRFLSQKALQRGAEVMINQTYLRSEHAGGWGYELILRDNEGQIKKVNTEFVIDASGRRSVFSLEQGSVKRNFTPLICLGVRFQKTNANLSIPKLTYLEAVDCGWWYTAPLPDQLVLVTFYTDAQMVKEYALNKMTNWSTLLNRTIETKKILNGWNSADARPIGFPASSYILEKFSGDDWIAIGDAASAFDPIMAQGIMKAILNARLAAKVTSRLLLEKSNEINLYQNHVVEWFDRYVHMRQHIYGLEKRWTSFPFWKKMMTKLSSHQFAEISTAG